MFTRFIAPLLLILCLIGCTPKSEIRTAHLNGVDIGYQIKGNGTPLLMIMGYAGTMDIWDSTLVDNLAKNYQVILYDNRNLGHSPTSPETVSIPLMARDSLALLDTLGIQKAHILGWSMGSIIAQEIALTQPDAVDKLILYGTTDSTKEVMQAVTRLDRLTPEQFVAQLFPRQWVSRHPDIFSRLPWPTIPPTPEAVKRQRDALAAWPGTTARLRDIGQDTLLIVGEEDTVTPPDSSIAMAEAIPGAWLARFKGAGHWLMYQAPEDMASTIHHFIKGRQDLLR